MRRSGLFTAESQRVLNYSEVIQCFPSDEPDELDLEMKNDIPTAIRAGASTMTAKAQNALSLMKWKLIIAISAMAIDANAPAAATTM
jgi:hypothetical protein